jgi:hypothetical protein
VSMAGLGQGAGDVQWACMGKLVVAKLGVTGVLVGGFITIPVLYHIIHLIPGTPKFCHIICIINW